MPPSILFICRSCHRSQQRPPEQPADGAALCDRIEELHLNWQRQTELEIRGVNCLWTCDHACAVALMAEGKPTYALANVPIQDGNLDDVAEAVLKLSERYLDSQNGSIPWGQFPNVLQTNFVARIPPSTPTTQPRQTDMTR
jgi:predicted metal-binding protein